MAGEWLFNAWYQVAWSSELENLPLLVRTVLDIPLLIFRDEEGHVRALHDACPHRFAPLSRGRLCGGLVTCGYHGLVFDGNGRCVSNPHGGISKALKVRSFPVAEHHRGVWIWMGEGEPDGASVPDLGVVDGIPMTALVEGRLPTRANYQLISDNIMDLSHADYLHPDTLGGMMSTARCAVWEENGVVISEWIARDCAAPPALAGKLERGGRVDFLVSVRWHAPAVIILQTGMVPAGSGLDLVPTATTVHSMTPETATATHYFFLVVRDGDVNDEAANEAMREQAMSIFSNEDKPMLEAQQERMGTDDLWSLKPALLSIDKGAVLARRKLEQLIAREQGLREAAPLDR